MRLLARLVKICAWLSRCISSLTRVSCWRTGKGRVHTVWGGMCVGVPCIERSAPRPTTIIVSRISILPPSAGLPPGPLAPLPSLWTVPFPIVMYPRSHLRALPPITLQPSTLHHLQLLLQALDLIDEAFFFLRGGGRR